MWQFKSLWQLTIYRSIYFTIWLLPVSGEAWAWPSSTTSCSPKWTSQTKSKCFHGLIPHSQTTPSYQGQTSLQGMFTVYGQLILLTLSVTWSQPCTKSTTDSKRHQKTCSPNDRWCLLIILADMLVWDKQQQQGASKAWVCGVGCKISREIVRQ